MPIDKLLGMHMPSMRLMFSWENCRTLIRVLSSWVKMFVYTLIAMKNLFNCSMGKGMTNLPMKKWVMSHVNS